MRNWNLQIKKGSPKRALLPDYLWGIETDVVNIFESKIIASRLPMRNWNPYEPNRLTRVVPLPDYLWGIETRNLYVCWVCGKGFQTTYEELKLFFLIGPLHQPFRFQTTYEELKPPPTTSNPLLKSPASRLPMRNWNSELRVHIEPRPRRFQTTYEELKPIGSVESYQYNAASRLPMRNWNSDTSISIICKPQLPDYLWGIETDGASKRIYYRIDCFQTTYEELKL